MRLANVAAAAMAVMWAGLADPAVAQEKPEAAPAEPAEAATSADGEKGDADKNITITIDADLEFTGVELALQLALAADADKEKADLKSVQMVALSVAETDRQKAYVHLRIAGIYNERGDRKAAIYSLRTALPLADGDRSRGSLFYRILISLLTVYNEQGQLYGDEARPYLDIYRAIPDPDADPWERPSGTEDVIHTPTGIRLPHRLALFRREKLLVFDETGRDAGGQYKVESGQFPELTIYLVAEIGETAQDHFDGALGHILNRFEGAKLLSRGAFSAETDKGVVTGFAAHVNIPAHGHSAGLGSDLYVFVRKGSLIKFRVTFRERNRKTMDGVMHDIFRRFDWP